jgi:hypothetical protein
VRWHYRDPALVWLFVAAYVAHLLEEFFGGFPEWFGVVLGRPLPIPAFLLINGVALVAMILAVRAATRRESLGWLAIAVATVLLVNGVLHLLASLAWGQYSPGLITGVVVYVPLGLLALLRAWHQVPEPFFWRGVAAGLAAHAIVIVVAASAAGRL